MLGVQLTSPSKQRVKRVKRALVDSVKLVVKYFWPSRSLCQLSSEKSVKLNNLWSFFKIMAKKNLNPNYMTLSTVKDKLKVFNDFENKQNSKWSYVFFLYVKAYLLQKFIHYSIDWDKIQTLQKFGYDKINRKNADFSHELQLTQFYF